MEWLAAWLGYQYYLTPQPDNGLFYFFSLQFSVAGTEVRFYFSLSKAGQTSKADECIVGLWGESDSYVEAGIGPTGSECRQDGKVGKTG